MKSLTKIAAILPFALGAVTMTATAQDAAKGEQLFKRCAVCHSLEEGGRKIGPSLYGVFGRKSGSLDGFRYSPAMSGADITWDEETISAYLENPRGYIPGNRMAFPGLKAEQDRKDVVAYIKQATGAE